MSAKTEAKPELTMTESASCKHDTLAQAFLAAQMEMPAIDRDGENPHFKSKFVTLGNLLAKARPVLNRHGIAVAQFPIRGEDGVHVLLTSLIHESGERWDSEALLLLPQQNPQGQGAAITYMRRYALSAALGVADREDDDGGDGSIPKTAEEAATTKLSVKRAASLGKVVEDAGLADHLEAKLRGFGAKELTDLTEAQATRVYEWASAAADESAPKTAEESK